MNWARAFNDGVAAPVVLASTNEAVLRVVPLAALQQNAIDVPVDPSSLRIGATEWTTSLFPKDDRYLVPLKAAVRRAEKLEEGDTVTVRLTVVA
jgi:hypothetical protein